MRTAVVGSRSLTARLEGYIPDNATEIITGGATGIDTIAAEYAIRHSLSLRIIRPDYKKYPPKAAPIIRNKQIVQECDILIAVWDGLSRGTKFTIDYARKLNKDVRVFVKYHPI